MKKLVAMMTAGALVAGSAQAQCWTRDEASAAGVRQLQSMLMVTALRCQAAGTGMMGAYNAFVTSNRQAIVAQNERIRGHFVHAQGGVAGERAYDSFTTSMANGYGAGEGAPQSCAAAAALAQEAGSMQGSVDGLLLLVARLGLSAQLPEGRCEMAGPMTMASAAPVRQPAYAAAAPVPPDAYAEVLPVDYAPPPPAAAQPLAPTPASYMASAGADPR